MCRSHRVAALSLLVLLIGPTAAVFQKTERLMWQPYVGLVGYWQAREELKLTPDQIERIKKIGTDFEDEMRAAFRDNKLTGEERRKWFTDLSRRLEQMGKAAFGVQQGAAVAVDRERDHRIGKACSVPVEIEEGVGKGVRHRMVQRLIGIGHVDAALDRKSVV